MFWEKEKDKKPQSSIPRAQQAAPVSSQTSKVETFMPESNRRESSVSSSSQVQAIIGRSIILKGELSANEDLLIEGQFEGSVNLQDHCLTIGSNGKVKAEISARQVIVLGSVNGNINAREKIEVRKTGNVIGDLTSASIAIEEGAYFKGSIDILREGRQEEQSPITAPTVYEDNE